MNRILILEDEPKIVKFIEKGLKSHGFTVMVAENSGQALDLISGYTFDLLILDLGLPGKDGLNVLEELRGQGQRFPIIILTARNDIQDKISGFEGGADDYLTKPFRFEELLLRIRARLRTSQQENRHDEFELHAANITLDLRTRKAKIGDSWIELPAREFCLAETFLRHPGQVFSRSELLDRVWGYDHDSGTNVVDVYVGYLRKKLGDQRIETVRGMGYRLIS